MSDTANGHPRELLSAYLDDVLHIEERASVDRHLADCEDCRAELAAIGRLAQAIADEEVPPVPVDLVERVGRRLDAATVLRPRKFRYLVPATIAATIATIGILVAVQWREGHFMPPPPPAPMEQNPVRDEALPQDLPRTSTPTFATPDQEASGSAKEDRAKAVDSLEKDKKQNAEGAASPALERERQRNEEESRSAPGGEPAGVPGGIIGGVVGGVEGSAPAPPAAGFERKASADDGRADQPLLRAAPGAPPPASRVAAKAEAVSRCGDRWSDSGVRGSWSVPDPAAAGRELDGIALDVHGAGQWRGTADGRPYLLIIPRDHFSEVFFALGARGVSGLGESPAAPAGDDCLAISIAIVGGAPPPAQ